MWLIYAIIGAFGKGFTNLFRKKIAGNIDTDVYLWLTVTATLPIIGLLVLMSGSDISGLVAEKPLQTIANSAFWIAALVFNIQALKREELSYISPLSAFIPIFTLGLAWIFLSQSPPAAGLVGLAVVFMGAYIVNLKSDQVKWYEPITHLVKNSGARYAMGVSVCFAIVSVITKDVTNDGFHPIAWMFVLNVSSWLMLLYVPFKKQKQVKQALVKNRALLFAVTISTLVGGLFGIYAIAGTEYTAYAISVRRLDIIFSILLGWKMLKENNIRNKLIGGGLMTVGVVIVSVF